MVSSIRRRLAALLYHLCQSMRGWENAEIYYKEFIIINICKLPLNVSESVDFSPFSMGRSKCRALSVLMLGNLDLRLPSGLWKKSQVWKSGNCAMKRKKKNWPPVPSLLWVATWPIFRNDIFALMSHHRGTWTAISAPLVRISASLLWPRGETNNNVTSAHEGGVTRSCKPPFLHTSHEQLQIMATTNLLKD